MHTKLKRTGNRLAVVLDRHLLAAAGIDARTRLEISTCGDVIVISPVRSARRTGRLRTVTKRAHEHYAGAFKRLAD